MGKVIKVSGPLVVADGMADANMADVVRVGPTQLIGEILNMTGDRASIQVYEETSGLGPGAEVVTTGAPLSVELGPGLIESIYDGIQRPLEEIRSMAGAHIPRGIQAPPLPEDKKWSFTPVAKPGDAVVAGDVPPYTLYGGNPARFIKKRFDDALTALLLRLKWWDLPPEELAKLLPLLCDSDLERVRAALEERLS